MNMFMKERSVREYRSGLGISGAPGLGDLRGDFLLEVFAQFVPQGKSVIAAPLDRVDGNDSLHAVRKKNFIRLEQIARVIMSRPDVMKLGDKGADDAATTTGLVGRGENLPLDAPEQIGARVVKLDLTRPFTAARARNATIIF